MLESILLLTESDNKFKLGLEFAELWEDTTVLLARRHLVMVGLVRTRTPPRDMDAKFNLVVQRWADECICIYLRYVEN